MTFEHHADVLSYITINGATGVNDLAKHVGVSTSTMQKRLHNQSYFKLNSRRKWDLPENVAASQQLETVSNLDAVIKSQMGGIRATTELLYSSIDNLVTLLSTQSSQIVLPVATSAPKLDKSIQSMLDMCEIMQRVVKEQKDRIPEKYQTILSKTDWIALCCAKGTEYLQDVFGPELAAVMTTNAELSDDALKILQNYKKS